MIHITSIEEITSEIGEQILDLSIRYSALRDKEESKKLKVWTVFVQKLKVEKNIEMEEDVARDFLKDAATNLGNKRKVSLGNHQGVGVKSHENQPGPSNRAAAPFALRADISSSANLSGTRAVLSKRNSAKNAPAPYRFPLGARAFRGRGITSSSAASPAPASLRPRVTKRSVAASSLTAPASSAIPSRNPSRSLVAPSTTPSPNKISLRPRASQTIPDCSGLTIPTKKPRSSRQPLISCPSPAGPSTSSSALNSQRHTLPVAILVTSVDTASLYGSDRLKVVQNFEAEVPASCVEALRAAKLGREIRGKKNNGRDYPGIPSKKFTKEDEAQYGKVNEDEEVQAIYEIEGDSQRVRVCFEGWQAEWPQELRTVSQSSKGCLEDMNVRRDFLMEMERNGADKQVVKDWRYGNKLWTSVFWDYEDLSYFHTVIQRENGLGPVFYISLNSEKKHPPKFSYTTMNMMDLAVYKKCLKQRAHLPFRQLEEKRKMVVTEEMRETGCENPEGCVCNRRFEHLYGRFEIKNLQTDRNGRLIVRGLTKDSHRISIECSDACGCSQNCPRRHMQRGHQKPFVVYYEGPQKDNSLRAGADFREGEYIGEYNGHLKFPVAGENQSYEASVEQMVNGLVICARSQGNCIRFMSHSCNPNAMFVMTWTRVKETDPLLPRIAVFATRDIRMGEEVTICYWTKADVEGVAVTTECWCKELPYCIGKIPCRSD